MIGRTCYKAFGLVLESEFPLIQLPRIPAQVPDVRIVRADLSGLTPEQRQFSGSRTCPGISSAASRSPRRSPWPWSPELTALISPSRCTS